jgi:hypothetical protein
MLCLRFCSIGQAKSAPNPGAVFAAVIYGQALIMATANHTNITDPGMSVKCRFLIDPFQECYCMNITAHKISKIIAFCAGEFKSCPIYRSKCRQIELIEY